MTQKEERKAQAQEIISQLGGGRFIAMTGATMFCFDSEAPAANVAFYFRGSRIATHVKITLNVMDTYDLTFHKIRGADCKIVKEYSGVYNDMLQAVFTEATGLNTSLGTMRG